MTNFEPGSLMFAIFQSYWAIYKKYWDMADTADNWAMLTNDLLTFTRGYPAEESLCANLSSALLRSLHQKLRGDTISKTKEPTKYEETD